MKSGPNIKKLIFHKVSLIAIPAGGGIIDGVRFLSNPERMKVEILEAEKWVVAAIKLIRDADDPNPWRSSDDEAIAGEILRRIDEKKNKRAVFGRRSNGALD